MKSGLMLLCGALCAAGCSHTSRNRSAVLHKLTEHSQTLTTGVADALALEPADERSAPIELALKLAREDQRIEGLPADPLPIEKLLDPTAGPDRRALEDRFAEIHRLIARERRASGRLIELGEEFERAQNSRRARWAKWLGSSTALLAGAIALCVFFPAAFPILGRLLAWAVSKIPALSSALGVVSVKAFDSVVRGIEKARASGSGGGAQQLQNMAAETLPGGLELSLSREMDADHKRLVRSRKAALNL